MASGEKMRVAIMGATGSGKSTFINVASGSDLPVSDSLESCTIDVETATFFLDGRTVSLIDTPGFDDTTRSDTDVLKSITDYLASSYSQGARLAGVIYMQRITDNKMGGPSRRNFHILRNLIGDGGLRNVLLVTNMWSKVDPEDGEARERELAGKDKFFKPALDRGAQMLRHDGSQASAHTILRHLVGLEPSTLLVQDEMVNQAKNLADTTVGKDIMDTLKEQAERHAAALDDLCLGIEAAQVAEDEEMREALQEEAQKARERIEQIRGDLERMVANFATENIRLENENLWYKKDFGKQRADAEHALQLLAQERRARELAEAAKKRAELELAEAREREKREREKREKERWEYEQKEKEREKQQREKQEREKGERERLEREKQEKARQEQERKERVKKEQERAERERRELRERERVRQEREKSEKEKEKEKEKDSGYSCVIQ